ncbi:N-acetyltransferase [Bradyrhizobium arachidis]|uniref:GNAT family N-acetyltransferase n=1 Tax=Bradyrhizobium arachidis TaxID=858423 RepID=UPI002162B08A|nr:GNAT family N-acetyltransferase [Bradyrhizobium arachidis]UVO30694.1 GNAT family N-acetyltransferase [Bradyrhizobium arachidis]
MQSDHVDAISIKTVDLEDRSRVDAILTTAFAMCPLLRWLYPEPREYLQHFKGFIEYYCGNPFSSNSGAYLNDGDKGAILWQTQGEKRDNTIMMDFLLKSVPTHRRSETEKVFETFGKYHPHEPHWYLTMVAIDPMHQRSGLGEHLLRHATGISDNAQRLVHLEATSPHAMRLYERLGWNVLTEVQVGSSPPFFPMLRQPKPPEA